MYPENQYTDIFTEYDESVFSDGSIDPMGLRIIWTTLGNAVFHNRLNTISTDIRLYTLNLFHHYIIWNVSQRSAEALAAHTGREPYFNPVDLHDGLIIFLEALLTHAAYRIQKESDSDEVSGIPGTDKLAALITQQEDDKVRYLTVLRNAGILSRQHLLGIHGRHKGPFQQMGIFHKSDYYRNKEIWRDAGSYLFGGPPWREMTEQLTEILIGKVLQTGSGGKKTLRAEVEKILSPDLLHTYKKVLKTAVFRKESLQKFWINKLGLDKEEAALLYTEMKRAIRGQERLSNVDYENIIKQAADREGDRETPVIKAICSIEPLLTAIDKTANRLLLRGTDSVDDKIKQFIRHHFANNEIDADRTHTFLNERFFQGEALRRVKILSRIFLESRQEDDPVKYVTELSAYHKNIMASRNNLPWMSAGDNGRIIQHRSLLLTKEQVKRLSDHTWVNNYYLSTVLSIHQGLFGR